MVSAKDIIVKPIKSNIANDFVKKHHYSKKIAATTTLNFGFFINNKLIGVGQFGRPINKYLHINLVKNTGWNDFLELNRLVILDCTAKNAESRVISIMFKFIKKNYPNIKWIISFADACQCGDGTIYRASGFKLISINNSQQLYKLPNGDKLHLMSLQGGNYGAARKKMLASGYTKAKKYMIEELKGEKINGFQLKYIYFIDKSKENDLTVPIIPFSKINEVGAGMYKGKKRTIIKENACVNSENRNQSVNGGASPTHTLHLKEVANG